MLDGAKAVKPSNRPWISRKVIYELRSRPLPKPSGGGVTRICEAGYGAARIGMAFPCGALRPTAPASSLLAIKTFQRSMQGGHRSTLPMCARAR